MMADSLAAWRRYQEDVAALFRAMGCTAQVEKTLTGARAEHEIDVVARPVVGGVAMLWIVECKHWQSAVRKEQVMTLAHIAQDVGADRAFLLSESGFQSGALTAIRNTNITLTSIAELTEAAKNDISALLLKSLLADKARLEAQLRGHLYDDFGQYPEVVTADLDEVATLLGACLEMGLAITRAMTSDFPVSLSGMLGQGPGEWIDDAPALAARLKSEVEAIEIRTQSLDSKAEQNRLEVLRHADDLVAEVRTLVDLSATAFTRTGTAADRETARHPCLNAMRTIGDLAEGLRYRFRGRLGGELRALMRVLIDGIYLLLAEPIINDAEWGKIRAQTLNAAEQMSSAIALERNSSS